MKEYIWVYTNMESSETQEQNEEDEWKAAGALVTGIKNLVSLRQNR